MSGIPDGWAVTTLQELAGPTGLMDDGDWIESKDQDPNGEVRLIQLADIGDGHFIDKSSRFLNTGKAAELRCTYLRAGDLLIARMPDPLGRSCIFPEIEKPSVTAVDVCIWRSTPDTVDTRWLMHFVNSPEVRAAIQSQASGTTRQRVSGGNLKRLPIPVPPATEQRRIAAKLDSLRARSARARDELGHIPKLIERYKQAILAKAFSGELTKDWRAIRNRTFTWATKPISEIATVASGHTPKEIERFLSPKGTVPWFKVSSMNSPGNETELIESEFMLPEEAFERLSLRRFPPQSIVFPKRGGAIATNKKRRLRSAAALDLNLMALIPTDVHPDYLWWWVQGLDLAKLSNGSNVPQINHGDIAPLELALPPRDEQIEITRRLSVAWRWLQKVVAEHDLAERLLPKLDQAILAKAFRGELVTQDPNDEPASVLLERIKAERGEPTKRRGRR